MGSSKPRRRLPEQPIESTRRYPRQARSAATVQAIREAAFQVLEATGPVAFTTTRVAERAGVSVGTLYQYFSDREAILADVADARTQAARAATASHLEAQSTDIRPVVKALMATFEGRPETAATLAERLLQPPHDRSCGQARGRFMKELMKRIGAGSGLNREAVFILSHLLVGLVYAAALDEEVGLNKNLFEDELVFLFDSYAAALAAKTRSGDRT